jgi:aminoglycoside 2''-phosphotransferase
LDLETLVAKVREAFPGLPIAQAEIEDRGGDHRVLLVDDEYVFRFPRNADNDLPLEIAVLSALRDRCVVPVPHYEFISPDFAFAGYRLLRGAELTRALFASLQTSSQRHVLDQAVLLLNTLHGLEPRQIARDYTWRKVWTPRQFTDRGRKRLVAAAPSFPSLVAEIERFYRSYQNDEAPYLAVLHGDLVEEHLLLSSDHGLAGVIDFGDVGLGDPAEDLKGFWAYGAAAAKYAISRAAENSADSGLLDRSKRAYLRYCIDRFLEQLDEDGPQKARPRAARLRTLLTETPWR